MMQRRRSFHRSRKRLSSALRSFAALHGWSVVGLVDSLADRYPLPPLIGARSAQASLAVQGSWGGQPAWLAHVLVRRQPRPATSSTWERETEVVVATLRLWPQSAWLRVLQDPDLYVAGDPPAVRELVTGALVQARGQGMLRADELMALTEDELVHVGSPSRADVADLTRRLQLLGRLAEILDGQCG